MSEKITLEIFKKAVAVLKRNAIKPTVISTEEEARKATAYDAVFGFDNQWKVGDSYYTFPIKNSNTGNIGG